MECWGETRRTHLCAGVNVDSHYTLPVEIHSIRFTDAGPMFHALIGSNRVRFGKRFHNAARKEYSRWEWRRQPSEWHARTSMAKKLNALVSNTVAVSGLASLTVPLPRWKKSNTNHIPPSLPTTTTDALHKG